MATRGFNVRRSGPLPGEAIRSKLFEINWLLPTLVGVVGLVGVTMIFAATDGVWRYGAFQHLVRIALGGLVMLCIALIDIRLWYRLAYPIYAIALGLLIGVEFVGVEVNGSTRGTTGVLIVFLAGISWRVIGLASLFAAVAIPLFYRFGLKPYQQKRFSTFWDPSHDPTGASYHIIQSKIALGSGGLNGKGFMRGTQRQGEYVPENTTDFIFTIIGEEFGLIGGLMTLGLYMAVISVCIWLSLKCKEMFSKLLILGLTTTFTLYIFINMGMVMGLAPVVGVPLPLISYGGTVILVVMGGFGLILSAHLHRDVELPRSG